MHKEQNQKYSENIFSDISVNEIETFYSHGSSLPFVIQKEENNNRYYTESNINNNQEEKNYYEIYKKIREEDFFAMINAIEKQSIVQNYNTEIKNYYIEYSQNYLQTDDIDKSIEKLLKEKGYTIKGSISKEDFFDFDGKWLSYTIEVNEEVKNIEDYIKLEKEILTQLELPKKKIMLELL